MTNRLIQLQALLTRMDNMRKIGVYLNEDQRPDIEAEIKKIKDDELLEKLNEISPNDKEQEIHSTPLNMATLNTIANDSPQNANDFAQNANDLAKNANGTCLQGQSINTLCNILSKEFGRRLTNMKNSNILLEDRKKTIIKIIERECKKYNKDMNLIMNKYVPSLQPKKPKADWVNEFKIGEEILVKVGKYCYGLRVKAVVKKLNKTGISVQLYNYYKIKDQIAIAEQTIGRTRLVWTDLNKKSKVVYSRKNIIKYDEYYNDEFKEGKMTVDYGY